MTEKEILLLLKEVLEDGEYATYDDGDISGMNPHWHFSVRNAQMAIDCRLAIIEERERDSA